MYLRANLIEIVLACDLMILSNCPSVKHLPLILVL